MSRAMNDKAFDILIKIQNHENSYISDLKELVREMERDFYKAKMSQQKTIDKQNEIIEKMEEALEWYGEKENWRQGVDDFGLSLIEKEDCDNLFLGGKRARQCLAEIKEMRDK